MPRERWGERPGRSDDGQVLVVVAIGLVVVLMFVALAVDVGHWYGQRRHMQNAADAGALSGAYQFCYEASKTETAVLDAALDYAEMNGADRALSDVRFVEEDGMVVLTATVRADFFFARIIPGMSEFPISAVAAAQCGAADEGCGMWPVAFDYPSYIDESLTGECNGPDEWDDGEFASNWPPAEGINDHSQWILWAGDNTDYDPGVVERNCAFEGYSPGYTYKFASVVGGSPMDPGNRGWVALRLLPGYQIPNDSVWEECNSAGNCGASALSCWLEHGYIGSVAIGDCLATEDGNIQSALTKYATLREGDVVSVILYDHPGTGSPCDPSSNPATCSGNKAYHIVGIGCVRVEHVYDGKKCDPPRCNPAVSKDPITWRQYVLGGSNPGDLEFTIKASATTYEVAPGIYGTDDYGWGCAYNKASKKWVCADDEPLEASCPAEGTGIVITKMCACPPTVCVSSGGSGGNSAINAVSLVPVPLH